MIRATELIDEIPKSAEKSALQWAEYDDGFLNVQPDYEGTGPFVQAYHPLGLQCCPYLQSGQQGSVMVLDDSRTHSSIDLRKAKCVSTRCLPAVTHAGTKPDLVIRTKTWPARSGAPQRLRTRAPLPLKPPRGAKLTIDGSTVTIDGSTVTIAGRTVNVGGPDGDAMAPRGGLDAYLKALEAALDAWRRARVRRWQS